jgi:Zn-dependent membrane protease YugP
MYFPYYLDWTILLIIPGIIVAVWAQSRVNKAYRTFSKIPVSSGITGREAAQRILESGGVRNVDIRMTNGRLSDNYNPRKKTLNLSEANYSGSSIAAVAVAAHESGHALQHSTGFFPLQIRSLMAPVISAASYMLWPLLIVGMMAGFMEQTIHIVVYIFVGIFVFQLVTLPVEYNASRRALSALVAGDILSEEEIYGARRMLGAAALTYVAATLIALLNVIRFAAISRRRG